MFSRGNPGKRSTCIGLAYSTPSTSARLHTRADRLQAIVVDPSGTLPEIGDSVLAHRRVPQLPLLERVDAVVCHAGHNTVCETLWHGLPLVVAPIRDDQAVVDGWHIDASFPGEDLDAGSTDYRRWWANVESKDCALRMFFLCSDVGEDDAPTRIASAPTWMPHGCWSPRARRAWRPGNRPGARSLPPGIARSRTPRARPGTSTSATRSRCTPANRTAERVRASWASRSSPRPGRSSLRERTGPTHPSRSRRPTGGHGW
ncbi:glycosyltransferase [Streptomyces nigrescens]